MANLTKNASLAAAMNANAQSCTPIGSEGRGRGRRRRCNDLCRCVHGELWCPLLLIYPLIAKAVPSCHLPREVAQMSGFYGLGSGWRGGSCSKRAQMPAPKRCFRPKRGTKSGRSGLLPACGAWSEERCDKTVRPGSAKSLIRTPENQLSDRNKISYSILEHRVQWPVRVSTLRLTSVSDL